MIDAARMLASLRAGGNAARRGQSRAQYNRSGNRRSSGALTRRGAFSSALPANARRAHATRSRHPSWQLGGVNLRQRASTIGRLA